MYFVYWSRKWNQSHHQATNRFDIVDGVMMSSRRKQLEIINSILWGQFANNLAAG